MTAVTITPTPTPAQEGKIAYNAPLILRAYQIEALKALWAFWLAGGGNPLIDLATGLGKSFLIAELGRRFCKNNRRTQPRA
jgi:superfamily II DNA or RNA helicase